MALTYSDKLRCDPARRGLLRAGAALSFRDANLWSYVVNNCTRQ